MSCTVKSHFRRFAACVIPSLLAFALSGLYVIVDGFFVGNRIGDIGLSTINLVYPVECLFQAVGTGIGMGGAVLYTLNRCDGKPDRAAADLWLMNLLLLGFSVFFTIFFYVNIDWIISGLGGTGELAFLGREYLAIIIFGSIPQIFATGLIPIIRNNNGATYAMISMASGFIGNILMDFLFVWVLELSVRGAALATILGQALTAVLALLFVIRHRIPMFGRIRAREKSVTAQEKSVAAQEKSMAAHKRSIAAQETGRILKTGLSPFGLTISPIVSLFFINRYSLVYGGEDAVAAYACIVYVVTILYMMFQGVGDGAQPLMSESFGRGNQREMELYLRMGLIASEAVAAAGIILIGLGKYRIAGLFGASDLVSEMTAQSLPVFLVGMPFMALSRLCSSVFYAQERNINAFVLVYAEPALLILFLQFLPGQHGQDGVWWSMALAQIVNACIAIAELLFIRKHVPDAAVQPWESEPDQNARAERR